MKDTEKIIKHLIRQDMMYHRMVSGLQAYEVHVEFYPDISSAIQMLLGMDDEDLWDDWDNEYTQFMTKAIELDIRNELHVQSWVEECYIRITA